MQIRVVTHTSRRRREEKRQMTFGSGQYTYKLAAWHAEFPGDWSPTEVLGLAIDSQDRLYSFNAGEYPVTVFDSGGKLLDTWGKDFITHPHLACMASDDTIYYADDANHTVSKITPDGKVLMTLGERDKPSDTGYTLVSESGEPIHPLEAIRTTKRGGPPFNCPTDVAISSNGDIFVTDGYGNARVHKFSSDGRLIKSWGEPGSGPSQFVLPHAIAIDARERLLVADRHNSRIQIFDTDGNYLTEWKDVELPTDILIDRDQTVYVTEMVPRISIYDLEGRLLARWGNQGAPEDGALMVTLHSVALDSHGSIYVGEVMAIESAAFRETRKGRMIHKFVRK
jgi:hypothetical protein